VHEVERRLAAHERRIREVGGLLRERGGARAVAAPRLAVAADAVLREHAAPSLGDGGAGGMISTLTPVACASQPTRASTSAATVSRGAFPSTPGRRP
jgi:hypothetical protein